MTIPRVIVSYAFSGGTQREDQFTTRLVNDLRAAGADVVVDEASSANDDLAQSLNHLLPGCHWLVLVQTPQALTSPQVQFTVNAALNLVAQQRMREVLRVIAEPCDPQEVPPIWRTLRVFDASKDYARALTRLLLAIGLAGQVMPVKYYMQPGGASSPVPHVSLPPSPLEDRPVPLSKLTSKKNAIPSVSIFDRPAPFPALSSRRRLGWTVFFSVAAMSAFMLIIVLVIAGMLYYGHQTVYATSVTVNFSSKPQVVSQVFTITANPDPSVKSVNVDTKTIPAKVFVNKRSGTGSAQTTGKVNCIIGLFCQQAVADSDVSGLADKMRPNLQHQLTLDLQKQIAAVKGTQAGSLYFNDVSVTPTPDIGTVSNTVTVILVEQGSVEYIVNADAVSVAHQLLIQQAQKLGPNYIFPAPGSMISFGSPVVESIDNATKVLTVKIAAAGIALYRFPATELQTIKHHLQGQTVNNARIYIGQQQGVDSATINIKFTHGGGTMLPGDLQQIQIVTIDPTTLPVVDLPKVPTPTSTPSTNVTPSASPTANT